MKKILFVYDHPYPEQLKGDGLWRALDLLERDFEIIRLNLQNYQRSVPFEPGIYTGIDFVLGHGAFNSSVDKFILDGDEWDDSSKVGLCLAAQMPVNDTAKNYDIIFYETEEIRKWLEVSGLTKLKHAFGINTDIFNEGITQGGDNYPEIWDTISVGSFSAWHRQDKLYDLPGHNLAVGHIQQDNIQESFNYVANLLLKGWTISNWVDHEKLAELYNMSKKFVATADFGQERAVLEARSCGIDVEVPDDNPKLKELLTSPIWDVQYYAQQLKEGILACL